MCLVTMVCEILMARPAAEKLPAAATLANTSKLVSRSSTEHLTS
jgi:hypothetical protein